MVRMGLPRFFLESLDGDVLRLSGAEARHAARSRRLVIGEHICLFDLTGAEVIGVIAAISPDSVEIRVEERRAAAVPSGVRLTVATAIPKGQRAEWMIEKLAELGVASVWPIETRRSVVAPGAGRVDKWRRIARESNKQSGRSYPMVINEPIGLLGVVERFAAFGGVWLADREGGRVTTGAQTSAQLVLVGPEGGFDPSERAAVIAGGAKPLRLGRHILRVETAAIAAAVLICGE